MTTLTANNPTRKEKKNLRLVDIARQLEEELKLQPREYRSKSYQNTFLGVEAIDFIERLLVVNNVDHHEEEQTEERESQHSSSSHHHHHHCHDDSLALVVYPDEEEDERTYCYRKYATIVAQTIQEQFHLFKRAGRDDHHHHEEIVDEYYIYIFTYHDKKESNRKEIADTNHDDKIFFERLFNGELAVKEEQNSDSQNFNKQMFDELIELQKDDEPAILMFDETTPVDMKRAASILESSVHVKTHRYEGMEFDNTFVGSDAVDVLVKYGMAKNRTEAVKLGKQLEQEHNLFRHCDTAANRNAEEDLKPFADNYFFYRFTNEGERVGLVRADDDKDDYLYSDEEVSKDDALGFIAEDLKQNVVVKDRRHHLKKFRQSFVGSDAVSFLVEKGYADNRISAVDLGKQLATELNLFGKAGHKSAVDFKDDHAFYSFEDDADEEVTETETEDEDEAEKTRIKIWRKSVHKYKQKAELTELKRQETYHEESKAKRWIRSFRRLDPRYRILEHFRTVSQLGEERPDFTTLHPLLRLWYLLRSRNVFSVWRETKNDAIRKMMLGQAVGKGLDIKGKSAKEGTNAGYVPFLQIGVNKHKREIDTLSRKDKVRVFFHPSAEEAVTQRLQKCSQTMVDRVKAAQKVIKNAPRNDRIGDDDVELQAKLKSARTTVEDWGMEDSSIEVIDAYEEDCIGFEISIRLFWNAFFEDTDITRVPGSQYDTKRPSSPKSQDANIAAVCTKEKKEGLPRPVVWQSDKSDPFNPQQFLMAYEELGRVLPVASDFDAFLIGTRRFQFDPTEDDFPPEQLQTLKWSVKQIGSILDIPPRPGSWTKRWAENYCRQKDSGSISYPPYPYGYADKKTKRMVVDAVEALSVDGSVRHGAEAFNYSIPQEMDQKFLVISDCRGTDCKSGKPWHFRTVEEERNKIDGLEERGMIPWRYMNESELIDFLSDKIDHGYTFPLSPKWILCDPGWKKLYDKLVASNNEEVNNAMKIWYPTDVRKDIEQIAANHPRGFEGGVLRSQEEVQEHFTPILKEENWVFRRSALGYVRPAKKGEKIVTTAHGVLEAENIVKDDTSVVMYNASGSSYYVATREEFDSNYLSNLSPIDISKTPLPEGIARRLVNDGFQECKSKRKVFAHQVTNDDMDWFRFGSPPKSGKDGKASHFVAPWGEFTRVEEGDVLVMKYPDGNDEIYRIEYYSFKGTYTQLNVEREEGMKASRSMVSARKGLGTSARNVKQKDQSPARNGSKCSLGFEGQRQRGQDEVQKRFLPLLRKKGGIFSKPTSTTAYVRRGRKGEAVVTDIAGKQETQNVVEDDTSWIVCGKSHEFYVVKNHIFHARYDLASARPLDSDTDSALPARLLKENFQECSMKAVPMHAHEVKKEDLVWFNFGKSLRGEDAFSYFEAPWGEPLRVEVGDMLVTQYHEGNDEVYRVEKLAFEISYAVHRGKL